MFMLFPVLLMDKTKLGKEKGGELKTTTFWSISMFLTNATLLPYFATRAKSIGENRKEDETSTYVSDDVEIIHEEAENERRKRRKKRLAEQRFWYLRFVSWHVFSVVFCERICSVWRRAQFSRAMDVLRANFARRSRFRRVYVRHRPLLFVANLFHEESRSELLRHRPILTILWPRRLVD